MKQAVVLVALVGCSVGPRQADPQDPPPTPPPASWGVPITGGTITASRDGNHIAVADPDRDRIYLVDVTTSGVDTIELPANSQPGRIIEDAAGRFHVALRGSGQLLTISGGGDRLLRSVCGEPRGLAYAAKGDLIHVACATGELVSVPAAGGAPVRTLHLQRDLRDVIVRGAGLAVTTFRSAELLELDASGAVVGRLTSPVTHRTETDGGGGTLATGDVHAAIPEVAWRAIGLADGRVVVAHQRRLDGELSVMPGGYSNNCHGPIESALSVIDPDDVVTPVAPVLHGALPVDLAMAPDGSVLAVVSASDATVALVRSAQLAQPDDDKCDTPDADAISDLVQGRPTSVAFLPDGELVIYYPEPNTLAIVEGLATTTAPHRRIELGGEAGADTGRMLFHEPTGSGIACASCHPEGRDDGAVWTFHLLGARRTQSLAGGILSRAPYHWTGDMLDLPTLVDSVFTGRMLGGPVAADQVAALGAWLDRIPAPSGTTVSRAAALRGKALFESAAVGCIGCHGGPLLTNNQLVNVGTGELLKVPSLLGVAARAPFLHDGCAATLRDRFGPCGGGDNHGHTSQLTEAQLADLVAYLESL